MRQLGTGSGSRTGFGRLGLSLGLRRGRVANLSAVAFVSRLAAATSMEVTPPVMDVEVTGELSFGRRPRVANRSSVRLGGVVGFVGVACLVLARMTDGCLPEARNDLAAGDVVDESIVLLRLGVMGLSGVFAFRLDGCRVRPSGLGGMAGRGEVECVGGLRDAIGVVGWLCGLDTDRLRRVAKGEGEA